MGQDIDKIINVNEKVLWQGKPMILPYFARTTLTLVLYVFAVIFYDPSDLLLILFGIFLAIPIVWKLLAYPWIHYYITDKRVVAQSGIIGRDFGIIDFDQITNSNVSRGLLDILFGGSGKSGTISIAIPGEITRQGTTGRFITLSHIPNAYEVFSIFKKVSFDIKSDVEYPNALRPKENKGYNTDYLQEDTKKENPLDNNQSGL